MNEFPSTGVTRLPGVLLVVVDKGRVAITRYGRRRYVTMVIDDYQRLCDETDDPRKSYAVKDTRDPRFSPLEGKFAKLSDSEKFCPTTSGIMSRLGFAGVLRLHFTRPYRAEVVAGFRTSSPVAH